MNHLPFTLLAYLFNATAVTVDKFLLIKHIPNPLLYIFYFSVFSALALLALPFTHIPTLTVFVLASISTILWTFGAYFMFKALQIGQVSRVIPVIGTLIPLFLLSDAVITQTITANQIMAVLVLIAGLIALTVTSFGGSIKKEEIVLEVTSALLFAISYLVLRQAYLQENFLTVLVWSRFVILPVSLIILLIPSLKSQVFSSGDKPKFSLLSKPGLLFIFGQACGGSSELLITFSISLATPALVNSLQGSQYVFLFLFSQLLNKKFPQVFQETLNLSGWISKILGVILIGAGLYLLAK